MSCQPKLFFFVFAAFGFIGLLTTIWLSPWFRHLYLEKVRSMVTLESHNQVTLRQWMFPTNEPPMYAEFFFFNITNKEDALQGPRRHPLSYAPINLSVVSLWVQVNLPV